MTREKLIITSNAFILAGLGILVGLAAGSTPEERLKYSVAFAGYGGLIGAFVGWIKTASLWY